MLAESSDLILLSFANYLLNLTRYRRKGGQILPEPLDSYERRILEVLQEDAGLSTAAVAERVGLSASPCWRRIDRLERDGFIKRKVAIVDRKKVGLNAQIFAQVKLNAHGRANLDEFSSAIRDFPEVLECHLMAGQSDYILRVVCRDHEDFERLHRRLSARLPGVARIHSNMSIRRVKARTGLPI